MDGIHDLGGRHGFGKIDVDEGDEQFHEPYEARIRSIAYAITPAPDWSKDWFRHCRELISPEDYLSRPYFDQWAQAYCAMLVNSGWATVQECASGKMEKPVNGLPPPKTAEQARAAVLKAVRFDGEISDKPAWKVTDEVRTISSVTTGHTRLPVYARDRIGRIIDHHGAHIFPDAMAVKEKRFEHLYTVEFDMNQLWPEVEDSNDTLTLDLWESYLERV